MTKVRAGRGGKAGRRRPGTVTPPVTTTGHTFKASSVDGAGFQQALAVANPAHGHTAQVAVGYSDIAGFHVTTDRAATWTQANEGLIETWHKKGVAVEFDKHNPNCVLAYFSNAHITGTAAADDVGRKAGILYGVINPATKVIKWTILVDQNITSGPTYPNGLYPAAAEGPNEQLSRQTGKMLACDPFHENRWYVGTRQGVQVVTVTRNASGDATGATVSNLARNTIGAGGERDMVTGLVVGLESTATDTVLYFTVRAGGLNAGLNRRFACGPNQTGTTVLTRLAGTNSVTTTQGAEGLDTQMENGFAVVYVAAGVQFRKWTQTTAGTTSAVGAWTINDPPGANALLRLKGVSTTRSGGVTRVITCHYSEDGPFPKIYWSEDGAATWTAVTNSKVSTKIAGGAVDWWLIMYKDYYKLTDATGGWDGSQIALWPDAPTQCLVSGRSGFWRTTDVNGTGANWHPAVRGLKATVANYCAPSPITAGQVVVGDVDWASILSTDGFESAEPILDEGQLGSPCYQIDWFGNAYVRCQGDRDSPNSGGGVVHVANPFGAATRVKLSGFTTARVFGVAQGATSGGTPVTVAAVEGVGIQRREGAISSTTHTSFTTPTSASATASVIGGQRSPLLWPGDKAAGTAGANVYLVASASSGAGAGIWRSTDRGSTWSQVLAFTTQQRFSAQIIADPTDNNRLYFTRDDGAAGTTGVYRVEDAPGAFTVTRILTLTSPGPIAIDPRNGNLYAIALPDDAGGNRILYTTTPKVASPTWTAINSQYVKSAMGSAHHMAIGLDGRIYIADYTGGYLVGVPGSIAAEPVDPEYVPSALMTGFTDRWGQSPASAGVTNSTYTQVVKNAVAKVDWADLQPTDGATPSLDIFTKDDTNAHSTVTLRQMIANVKAQGGKIRLRVMAGVYAPNWAKSIGGSPMPWFDDRTTAGSTTGNSFTIGRWWHTVYRAKYADLQNKLAALLDAEPTITDVTIVGTMTVYSEPMIRQMSDPTIYSPNNRQTLLDTASEAQPYSKDIDIAALKASIDAHKVWKQTHSSLAVNPYQYVVSISSAPSSDTATTTMIMDYCYTSLGKLAAFGNHSIRDNQQAYDDATGAGEGGNMKGYNESNIGVVYPKMKAMKDLGCGVYFQTDVPRRTGRLASASPQALTNATVNWNDGGGNRTILGGPAADLALHFGGTDLELPRNYDPGSTVNATYPTAAKFTSIAQANAYIAAMGGTLTPAEPEPEPPPPVSPTFTVTETDVVRAIFHDGALTPMPAGSIYAANDHVTATSIATRDWNKGAVLHAAPRPNPSSGAAWHGAPWDWTIDGILEENYKVFNIWHEVIPYKFSGLPRNVRVQYCKLEAWTLPANLSGWTKVLGPGAATGYQTTIGRPSGGYFENNPIYKKHPFTTAEGGGVANVEGWPASPAAKWRAETEARGGGWSIALNPQLTSGGAVIDDMAILHGSFTNMTGQKRVTVPTGGYFAYSGWMRLIMEDYSTVPASAGWVGAFGADAFTSLTDGASQRSTSACNPRKVELSSQWKWVGFCAGSATQIRTNFPKLPFVS